MKKSIVSTILITAMLSGCASTEDGRLTQAQGTGIGAVGGAVLGGLAGAAFGGQDAIAKGALIGAGAGALGGFAYGTHVANKKAQYANTEAYLDACIAAAAQTRNNAASYNNQLRKRIASIKASSTSATAANKKAARKEVATLRQGAKEELAKLEREIQVQEQVLKNEGGSGSSRLPSLKKEISALRSTKASLEQEMPKLASLDNQLDT